MIHMRHMADISIPTVWALIWHTPGIVCPFSIIPFFQICLEIFVILPKILIKFCTSTVYHLCVRLFELLFKCCVYFDAVSCGAEGKCFSPSVKVAPGPADEWWCICVFVFVFCICICVFVYLCICVFVYLCICVFVYFL